MNASAPRSAIALFLTAFSTGCTPLRLTDIVVEPSPHMATALVATWTMRMQSNPFLQNAGD